MIKAWATDGVEFPEGFVFPVTVLGTVADLHGAGTFVNSAPTRVDCYVHTEQASEEPKVPQRLEILPSPLHPELGTELAIGFEFAEQLSLALWLFRSTPFSIAVWPSRRTLPSALSLKGATLETFLRFARGLLDFHDDRQAYLVARVSPEVLADEEIRVLFVGGHRIDGEWLKARWPLMAATDLYERARRARERDIAFLFLMMSLEVIFNDGGPEISRRITQRCALLNGRTPAHRKQIFETLRRLYSRRSRLVHGDIFEKGSVLAISAENLSQATDLVRLSLLRFIALTSGKPKAILMKLLDDAVLDPSVSGRLEGDVEGYWEKHGVDFRAAFDVGS
jgi:hypothetical protein